MSAISRQVGTKIAVRTRLRAFALASRRYAWRLGVPHEEPRLDAPPASRVEKTVLVLGMHRSGTSAIAGLLENQGFQSGTGVRPGVADNLLGTFESPELVKLNEDILRLNGGSWSDPPDGPLEFLKSHVISRNKLLVSKTRRVLKDPRMLLLWRFWQQSAAPMIGVVRNPMAVSRSLQRRDPTLSDAACLTLWATYNRGLLELLKRRPFPVIRFTEGAPLEEQVANALTFYGFTVDQHFSFFDAGAVRGTVNEGEWRQQVSPRLVELWDEVLSSCWHIESSADTNLG